MSRRNRRRRKEPRKKRRVSPGGPPAQREMPSDGRPGRAERSVVLVAVLVALVAYLPRVCPTLSMNGDSAVFVSAAATWGVPQPPGYPLYTLLGHVATWLPVGDLPWRVHLLSALCHAAAVGVLAALVQRVSGSRAAAVGGALLVGFSRPFFLGSCYAEVFPLNDLLAAALLLVAHVYRERCLRASGEASKLRALAFLAFLSGVASAHHQMVVLLAPATLLIVAGSDLRLVLRGRVLVRLAALFAVPSLGLHALILAAASRNPPVNWGAVDGVGALWRLLSRADYGGLFSPFLGNRGDPASTQLAIYFETMWRGLGVLGLALAVLGVIALFRRDRLVAAWAGLAWAVAGPAFAVANSLPVGSEGGVAFAERFCTMSLVPLAVFAGEGVRVVERLLALALTPQLALVSGLSFLVPLLANAGDVDLSDDRRGSQFAADLLATPPDRALVLVTGDAMNGLTTYACAVSDACGERIVFSPGQLHMPWRVEQLRRRHPDLVLPEPKGRFITTREVVAANIDQRPVYLAAPLLDHEPPLRDLYGYVPEWLLLRTVKPQDVDRQRARFLRLAESFAAGRGCAGCRVRRTDLVYPSLEKIMLQTYVDAFINNARIARLYFSRPDLAEELERRALTIDPTRAGGYL